MVHQPIELVDGDKLGNVWRLNLGVNPKTIYED